MDIKRNNFDLLRFFASMQVAFGHTFAHLEIKNSILSALHLFLSAFPGVPIFFMISGFLITASYERNMNIKQYALNRIIRIYPALWVAFGVSVVIISSCGYLHLKNLNDFLKWSFSQLTLFQFYTPSFLREFGVGAVNGSLWTITVELQFYILVPILYGIIKKIIKKKRSTLFFLVLFFIAIIINMVCNQATLSYNIGVEGGKANYPTAIKILNITILPYLYCFFIGVLLRLFLDKIKAIIMGKYKFLCYFLLYIILYFLFQDFIRFNCSNPLAMILLAFPVISFAFSFTNLSNSIFKGNDFSYGIYIYHMLIVNVFVFFGFISSWYFFVFAIILSIIFSVLSWFLVEKKALSFKNNSLRKVLLTDAINSTKEVNIQQLPLVH